MGVDTQKTLFSAQTDAVLTRSEVAEMWGKRENTVSDNILRNKIVARQTTKGLWLISRASVVCLWGNPLHELSDDAERSGV